MSASVIKLSEHRPTPEALERAEANRFYCLRCDSTRFYLKADGTVNCAACNSHMRNLTISQVCE